MKKSTLIIIILALIILAWSPWLTKVKVENLINEKFQSEWYGVMDGCSLHEIKNTGRFIFGFKSSITYGCGMKIYNPEEELKVEWHGVYVSPFGTVHGDFLRTD
ncbi:MAG: hypothetical protein UT09_C0030G0005 [Parcubacteria group bacterium GW2011_GWF2_38_8]|nr:MAG: hypothetical protein UT09_C0030G0005 [Parcubacteria group bacterium GW2011_GWF2_38_8]